MKYKLLLFLPLLAVLMGGCGGVIPGVPQELQEYFPYKEGDTIVFSNGTDEEKLRINYTRVDQDYEYCGYADVKAFLPAKMVFRTDTASLFAFSGHISLYDELVRYCYFEVQIYERQRQVRFTFKNTIKSPKDTYRLVLENADAAEKQKEDEMYVARIVLERGKGITSFYDAANDVEWTLKEIIH